MGRERCSEWGLFSRNHCMTVHCVPCALAAFKKYRKKTKIIIKKAVGLGGVCVLLLGFFCSF